MAQLWSKIQTVKVDDDGNELKPRQHVIHDAAEYEKWAALELAGKEKANAEYEAWKKLGDPERAAELERRKKAKKGEAAA